ncbi:MAG: hypothetical protein K8W52_45775 [Deltaproteobacteria bacterium]|nr:hypothetical protein [Deltaproteobacteria bacterium]
MPTPPTLPSSRRALFAAAAIALALGGCDLLHAATADKLDSAQRDALADLFAQTGAIAGVIADPTTATSDDLADAMVLDQFVRLTGAGPATTARIAWAASAPAPACIVAEGNAITATDCEVPVAGQTCLVNGSATSAAEGAGTRYTGSVAMTGTGCPQRTVTFDFALTGPTDDPTALDGGLDFGENTPGNVYSGHLAFDGIGLASGCTVPSKGTLAVTVSGTFAGAPVDDAITISFNASPECGVILVEN